MQTLYFMKFGNQYSDGIKDMKGRMSRRKFQVLLASAVVAGHCTGALASGSSTTAEGYSVRFRYRRAYNQLSFWMRVTQKSNVDAPVAITQQLSTTADFTKIFKTWSYISSSATPNIGRWNMTLSPAEDQPGVSVYSRLVLTEGGQPVDEVWQLKAGKEPKHRVGDEE